MVVYNRIQKIHGDGITYHIFLQYEQFIFERSLEHRMNSIIFFTLFFSFTSFLQGNPIIHVFGDSHSLEFRGIRNCIQHYLGPVTMHRISRDGFEAMQWGINEGDVAVFAFGEIDVRCHIGRQRDLKSRDLEEIIHTLATDYVYQIVKNFPNIIRVIYSVTPPTKIIDSLEFPSYGPIEERVENTKLLNNALKSLCQTFGIEFLDVYDDYADKNGILCIEASDDNVHIRPEFNGIIQEKLFNILEQRGC
jgi:hypothetical protein